MRTIGVPDAAARLGQFLIFLQFLVIDLVVASALMALRMMMLSPSVVSLPFKLLLFVLLDGWTLVMGSLAGSFQWSSDGSADMILRAAREALWACAWASLPILVPILVVGLIVGVVQAATSINEATLSFVPKLVVTGIVLAVFCWAITATLVGFTYTMIVRMAVVVR